MGACDGCDCPMRITLDPINGPSQIRITSPGFPSKYPHRQNCQWTVRATEGKVLIAFEKFNIQSSPVCKKRDHLFLDQIERYNKIWLCAKKKYMTIKFFSNGKINAKGFKALLTAKVFRKIKVQKTEETWTSTASISPTMSASSAGSIKDSSVLQKKFKYFSSTR